MFVNYASILADYSNLSSLSGMSICYPKASKSSVFVIRGEIQLIITSLRRNPRWTSHQQVILINRFTIQNLIFPF